MHDNRMQTDLAQEHHILGEALLQVIVDHGIAAILDHDALAGEFLQPRQRLNQHFRLLIGAQIGMHVEMEPRSLQFSSHVLLSVTLPPLTGGCHAAHDWGWFGETTLSPVPPDSVLQLQ